MTIKYIAGCENSQSSPTRFCDVFDEWERARGHVLALIVGYYDDLTPSGPVAREQLAGTIEEVKSWTEGVCRSVATGPDAVRFFVYPAVAEEDGHRLACPRCRLDVDATEVVHGVVIGGDRAALAFEQTQPRAYRVYCEGDCAESDEAEDLFDALDAFMARQARRDAAP